MSILGKSVEFIVNEKHVMDVLKVVQGETSVWNNYVVRNCGWADRKKWFISLSVSNKKKERILKRLNELGFNYSIKECERYYVSKRGLFA